MSHISDHITNRSISCNTNYRSAHKLSCKVYIHIETVCRKLCFMDFDITLASQQTLFLCTKPYEFHCSTWSVHLEISAQFHNDGTAGHVIICPRSFRNRIIMCSQSQDFFCSIGSFDPCHYIA